MNRQHQIPAYAEYRAAEFNVGIGEEMSESTVCPACGGHRTNQGRYLGQTDYGLFGHVFRPRGLKPITLTGSDVAVGSTFNACLDCGLLWTGIDKSKLATVLEKHGKKSTRKRLNL